MRRLLIAIVVVFAGWAAMASATPQQAYGCAFSTTPTTYEGPQSRAPYVLGMDLAAYNMIDPDDTFFGTPRIEEGTRFNRTVAADPYIPPTLLKAIGWIESAQAQAASSVPWGAVGSTLISFDCGHGIMQITSGMTSSADGSRPSKQQALVATHYLYNIARGAAILVDKWNAAPEARPIAGTNTGSDPEIVENWYFAVWSYNGFTGPGANRSNHPRDPIYGSWPRTGFSCGPSNDGYGHSYGNYPYQEIIFGCMARPPSVDGTRVWQPLNATLPNLNNATWRDPLSLSNFTSSNGFAGMDMPSPSPSHTDSTDEPPASLTQLLRGAPTLFASKAQVSGNSNQVTIMNVGTGVLAWRIKVGQSWISVNKQGGVALADSVPCTQGAPCTRSPSITITANRNDATGWVDIESLTTGQVWRVNVVTVMYDVNCDGRTDPIDAALVLQRNAGVIASLACGQNADANSDGAVNAIDAAIILQVSAGLF